MRERKHYVEYCFPEDILISETAVKEVKERDINAVTREMPDHCCGFRFFDRTVTGIEVEGKKTTLTGGKFNISGWYYQGEKITLKQVKETYNECLISEITSFMEKHDCSAVVKTKYGVMPLYGNDTVL